MSVPHHCMEEDILGVDRVAQGLGHLPAMSVPHHCMEEDILEGQVAEQLLSKEDHPSNPEKDDIMASLQKRAWEESRQVIRLIRPAKHREGEESRREPGVENIG